MKVGNLSALRASGKKIPQDDINILVWLTVYPEIASHTCCHLAELPIVENQIDITERFAIHDHLGKLTATETFLAVYTIGVCTALWLIAAQVSMHEVWRYNLKLEVLVTSDHSVNIGGFTAALSLSSDV